MVELIKVEVKDKEILNNLLEKYLYEFSQYEKTDIDENGLYNYEWIDYYFTEKNRFPYFIKVNNHLAGFALISDYPEVPEESTTYCLSEFFILYKYRCKGYGKEAVFQVLNKHRGKWQLKCHPGNIVSTIFWEKVINEYTNGEFRLIKNYPNSEVDYEDGTKANVFFFHN